MKPKSKTVLSKDRVSSDTFHVGIELELKAPADGASTHDDEACRDSHRDSLTSYSIEGLLRDHLDLAREEAARVAPYFNSDRWIDDCMSDYECDGDCGNTLNSGDDVRYSLELNLRRLTGNNSVKVVSDSSIEVDEGSEVDAEVCWNYFASRDTLRDNSKILKYLSSQGCEFDKSCGLHINLNNYLAVPEAVIPTAQLSFLFNFVAKSRRNSDYCTRQGMSHDQKYSMIYHQGDRLEFRFFSPTLEADKLNHYVHLANVVYRRLAGKDARLSKRAEAYFLDKMQSVNGLSLEVAEDSIRQVNTLASVKVRIEAEARFADEIRARNNLAMLDSPVSDLITEAVSHV